MNRFTRSLAMASARHPWRTIASWVLLMAAVFALAGAVGGAFVDDYSAKGSQSARATELITENFPEAAKATALVVFASKDDQPLETRRADIADVLADAAKIAHVASVGDPFADGTVSEDGRIGYAQLTLDAPVRELDKPDFTVISEAVSTVEVDGLQVELGGDAVFLKAEDETSPHMAIGLLAALLVLLVVFGTVVAAVLPIGISLVAVGTSVGGIMLMTAVLDVSRQQSPSPVWSASVWASTTRCSWSPGIARTAPAARTTTPHWPPRWAAPGPLSSSPAGRSSSPPPPWPSPDSGCSPRSVWRPHSW